MLSGCSECLHLQGIRFKIEKYYLNGTQCHKIINYFPECNLDCIFISVFWLCTGLRIVVPTPGSGLINIGYVIEHGLQKYQTNRSKYSFLYCSRG